MICVQYSNSVFIIISFPNYQNSPFTQTLTPSVIIPLSANDQIVIGNRFIGSSGSLKGVINSVYIKTGFISSADIKSQFMAPRGSSPTPCSISLGCSQAWLLRMLAISSRIWWATMAGKTSYWPNTDNVALGTDGPTLAATKKLTISAIKMTTSRAISVEFWFKGPSKTTPFLWNSSGLLVPTR